jgi:hypothetical protein
MNRPWMKYYPRDWRADPQLRMCSLAARGLWADLLGYMHEAEPYGYFLIDGKKPDINNIAALVGRPLSEVRKAMGELGEYGVFSLSENQIIYSRRMVRDAAKEERDRANGKGGGNPQLTGRHNGRVNPPDKAQKPESDFLSSFPSSLSSSGDSLELKELEEEQACGKNDAKFAEFWLEYPNKVGKKDARKKFDEALKTVPFEILMGSLQAYRNKSDDRPWCNPATWLHQGRWDDQPAQQQPRGGVLGAFDEIERDIENGFDREAGEDAPLGLPPRRMG